MSPEGTLWTQGEDDMSERVHQCDKCATLVHDFNSGETAFIGADSKWELSVLSA